MNNKKGFTLIEIVICISLIVIIGVSSFIGIRLVDKRLVKDKLDQITDRAIEAAQVYLETNNEAKIQLYENNNGVSLPLQFLVSEGLLTLDGTKLNNNDIKDQYVISFLDGTNGSGKDNCEKITSTTSWGNDKEIYLCMNSDGSSNLATIDPTKYNNKTQAMNEPYYFKGMNPNNYVKIENSNIMCGRSYGNKLDNISDARILYVDRNDDLMIVTNSSNYSPCKKNDTYISSGSLNTKYFFNTLDSNSIVNAGSEYTSYRGESWLGKNYYRNSNLSLNYRYFVRLSSTCKIISGTGAYDNVFVIKCD